MKKLLVLLAMALLLTGCFGVDIPGLGFLQTDPGVRVYKTKDKTIIHITHKADGTVPNYKEIAPILKGVFK